MFTTYANKYYVPLCYEGVVGLENSWTPFDYGPRLCYVHIIERFSPPGRKENIKIKVKVMSICIAHIIHETSLRRSGIAHIGKG